MSRRTAISGTCGEKHLIKADDSPAGIDTTVVEVLAAVGKTHHHGNQRRGGQLRPAEMGILGGQTSPGESRAGNYQFILVLLSITVKLATWLTS